MFIRVLVGLSFLSSVPSFARISLSKEYSAPIAILKELETKLQKAQDRDAESKQYMAYYMIDGLKGVSMGCGPNLPDKDGKGCLLNFSLGSTSGASLSLSKKLQVKGKASEVEAALAKISPNSTQDHQHFGSLFEPADTFGSHYFCQPEGEDGKKSWGCYLFVNESAN